MPLPEGWIRYVSDFVPGLRVLRAIAAGDWGLEEFPFGETVRLL
ncbi:hypothetical protein [Microcoleus sp. herbarium2]